MTIWILAIILYGLLIYTGKFQGGIRMAISLIGVFLGALLAWPLSPKVKGLLAMTGVHHPFWSFFLPPLIVFGGFLFIFTALAFSIYFKIDLYYKYKAADDERLAFYHLNNGLGAALAVITGTIYLIVIGVAIYLTGYLTMQVKSDKENPIFLRLLNQMRADLKSSGLEKICEAVNPVPPAYFDVADTVGLLLKNPGLRNRLADYPPFIALGERQDFKDLGVDGDFMGLVTNGGTVFQILEHPKVQAMILDQSLLAQIQQVDFKDLLGFLRTDKSEKYAGEPLLGHWQIDLGNTLIALRKKNSWEPLEIRYMKNAIGRLLPDTTFLASADPNNSAYLKSTLNDFKLLNKVFALKLPKTITVPPAPPNLPAEATNAVVGLGNWRSEGDHYTVTLGDLGEGTATVKGERLDLTVLSQPFVFIKLD